MGHGGLLETHPSTSLTTAFNSQHKNGQVS
jgi:hypothetical protein